MLRLITARSEPREVLFLALSVTDLLWSPYVTGQTIIFLPCDFYLSSSSIFFFFLA